MGLVRLVMWGFRCLRCGHEWVPRGLEHSGEAKPTEPAEEPRVCPKCKSPYWNKPREQRLAKRPGK